MRDSRTPSRTLRFEGLCSAWEIRKRGLNDDQKRSMNKEALEEDYGLSGVVVTTRQMLLSAAFVRTEGGANFPDGVNKVAACVLANAYETGLVASNKGGVKSSTPPPGEPKEA
ncbi:unnamed protein product [Schistocephalus solidus]|uniref:Phage protein n=1 Tax=Schistocephalus solidus TaxID=70667 RepID=A0A183T9K9_SCHSO|nr:unnamed protein product [Schistocephalus solidus]